MVTGLSFAFGDRIGFLNAEHWDQVAVHGSVFISREYLSVLESGPLENTAMRFGMIYRGDSPAACFVTQTVDITADQLVRTVDQLSDEDRAQLAIKRLTRKVLEKVRRRVTVCGNLVSWGRDGIAWIPDESPAEIWQALSEGLYRLRRGDKLYGQPDYVIVKDLPSSAREESAAFGNMDYRAVDTEPNMVLHIDDSWARFDDYLDNLNRKYRKAARAVLARIERAHLSLRRVANLAERRDELHALYKAVASRANVRLTEVSPDYLPNLQARLGSDRFAALGLHRSSGELLGYVTVLRDRDTAVGYYLGIDYLSNQDLPIYHRLLFAVIEQALEWNCRRISFGRTALEAKSRLGCQPESMFVWVRHRVPLLNLVVRQVLKAVPHDEPPERNPFKTSP